MFAVFSVLSVDFIAKVQFIVGIIPRHTHARRLTITFYHRPAMSCALDPYLRSASLSFLLCLSRYPPSVRSRIREAWRYRHIPRCMRDIDPPERSRETNGQWWGKSADVRKKEPDGVQRERKGEREEGRGGRGERINCTGDADLFERDALAWYVMRLCVNRRARDTFERRCHFPSIDNANSRDLTREGINEGYGDDDGGWKSSLGREKRKREREMLFLSSRERFFLTAE